MLFLVACKMFLEYMSTYVHVNSRLYVFYTWPIYN